MRFWLVLCLSLMMVLNAAAQEQERKLVDRLLEPNMTLQNPQQNKNFSQSGITRTRMATTKSFYIAERKLAKNFVADRQVATTSYIATTFTTAQVNPRSWKQSRTYQTGPARPVPSPADGSRNYSTREFASTRKFNGRGKSQKSLDTHPHPLTIEEVRELLNKNK